MTDANRERLLRAGQAEVLAAVVAGAAVEEVFAALSGLAEQAWPGARCTISADPAAPVPDGAWSVPVVVAGAPLATLAVAMAGQPLPSPDDAELAGQLATLAAAALQRDSARRGREEVERRYQALVEELPVVTYAADRHGRTYYISPQVADLVGVPAEDYVGDDAHQVWIRLLHPDDRAAIEDWQQQVAAEQPWRGEYRIVLDNGATVWVRNVESVLRDSLGCVVGRHGVAFDVTSEMESLRALRAAEARYRSLVEQLPAVTYLCDLTGERSYTSPQIEQLVGMTPEQWETDWEQAVHPDDRDRVRTLYRHRRDRLEPFDAEYRVQTPAGRVTWISERAEPLVEVGGSTRFIQGIMFDVTDLKLAERAALESERRFREMLEGGSMSAVVVEVDGTVSFCNEHFAALVGYPREEIIGRDWIEMFSPPDDEIDHLWLEELRNGRVLAHMTDQVRTRSGDLREITWSNTSLRDPQGRLVAAASIGEDVTDRLRAERALRDSEARRRRVVAEMLRTAEEERTRIATELHDDTVQVMAATLLSLDRLGVALDAGDGDRAGVAARAARETLAAAVDRTRRLMFELRPPLLEAQGLDPALRDLAATAASEAGFEVSADIRVGRYPEPVETLAYRTAQEAITNVRKHAQASHLQLVLCEEGGGLRGEVSDDGRGFDVDHALDRRAMRLHMGLDAMMERVRLAGGEVDVRSQRGAGTSVRFRIPA